MDEGNIGDDSSEKINDLEEEMKPIQQRVNVPTEVCFRRHVPSLLHEGDGLGYYVDGVIVSSGI